MIFLKNKFSKMKPEDITLHFNEYISQIPQDKDLYEKLIHEQNLADAYNESFDNLTNYQIYYLLFVGDYYHGDGTVGRVCIEMIQKLAGKVQHQWPATWSVFNSMMIQAHFYVQQAGGKRKQLFLESNKNDKRWKPLNPFLAPVYQGDFRLMTPNTDPDSNIDPSKQADFSEVFIAGMRVTNFDKNGTNYFAAHGGNIQNYYETQTLAFGHVTPLFKIFEFKDETKYPKFSYPHNIVDGFEDFRVACKPVTPEEAKVGAAQKYFACVVSIDTHKEGCPRQSLVEIEYRKKHMVIKNLKPLVPKDKSVIVDNKECQKNWLPFFPEKSSAYYKSLLAIYSTEPLRIIHINTDTGACKDIYTAEKDSPFYGETFSFRGSSPPVLWKENIYLYSVHIVGYLPQQKGRVYYHRLVQLYHKQKEFRIEKISRLFYLNQNETVEYISGCFHDMKNKQIIFSYGFDDKQAWLAALSYEEIKQLFE